MLSKIFIGKANGVADSEMNARFFGLWRRSRRGRVRSGVSNNCRVRQPPLLTGGFVLNSNFCCPKFDDKTRGESLRSTSSRRESIGAMFQWDLRRERKIMKVWAKNVG